MLGRMKTEKQIALLGMDVGTCRGKGPFFLAVQSTMDSEIWTQKKKTRKERDAISKRNKKKEATWPMEKQTAFSMMKVSLFTR